MWENLVSLFFGQAARFGERPFLWSKAEGRYTSQTWREAATAVGALSGGLRRLGVERGDRVMIVAENRPEWPIADLAIMAAGGITVPSFTTNTAREHGFVLGHSGARGVIVSTRRLAGRVLEAVREAAHVRFVIVIEPPGDLTAPAPVALHDWNAVLASGDGGTAAETAALGPGDPACIIYTSGTGGEPKGVVLPHRAILHNCLGGMDALAEIGDGDDVFLSFLPLSHAYEHSIGQFLPIAVGGEIYYAEGVERLATNMLEARPTIVTAVPRFYELMRQRIEKQIAKAAPPQRMLFRVALALGRKRLSGAALGPIERAGDALAERLVRTRVRARFGGRIKAMISGGAPLQPELGAYFRALGVPVFQGYGQTETGPLVSVNRPSRVRMDTVGPPMTGTEVKIADDGEILVRGPAVMLGYWRNEDATREALRDGWLHTGDIGAIDDDGHLRITDRKKDIIVNSGGDNIAPARIEGLLTARTEIAQVMVYGDGRPHIVALLVPEPGWLKDWARTAGVSLEGKGWCEEPALMQALGRVVDEVNAGLSVIERIRRFAVLPEPFSLDNGQMTPTLKIRRHVIRAAYEDRIRALYG